ncbi:DUF58 domain-containing protein [Halorussus lipolyticus]|uniref:DUF58 domain-containing protein n=1 Tax=Halorussus lipolyticus TaxID=3034024 RepID=UPI0023E877D3|nr:DUF58 domain-containing protein [Halorussus sp. DT80]
MLTRRGWALTAVTVLAFGMAAWFSARSLNAVVGPALVALAAGWLQFRRADQPQLDTKTPDYGFAGETVTVSLDFDAPTPLSGTVRLESGDGLDVQNPEVETTIADDEIDFDVALGERGVQSVGPVEVVAEDVLGVWSETYTYPVTSELVVFPRIHRLQDASDLTALHREFGLGGRDRFDQLREYERGDPLRDVHWKSSAKRADDELVVMEFEANEEREQVELLAEADGGRMDDVAEAAASVLTYLLDAGLAVGLTVPGGRVEPGAGEDHRTELLTLLARSNPGTVSDRRREGTDVLVAGRAESESVTVTIGDRTVTFGQLSGESGSAAGGTSSEADPEPSKADRESQVTADGGERR